MAVGCMDGGLWVRVRQACGVLTAAFVEFSHLEGKDLRECGEFCCAETKRHVRAPQTEEYRRRPSQLSL